jgi:anti-sigma B factor antagonist
MRESLREQDSFVVWRSYRQDPCNQTLTMAGRMSQKPHTFAPKGKIEMTISTESMDGDITRVLLDGRLDIQGAAAIDLKMNVLAGSSKFLLIDLRNVSFVGSMGLRSIVVPAQAVRRRGGKVALFGPVPMVEEVLKTSNIESLIPIFHDLDSAVASLC